MHSLRVTSRKKRYTARRSKAPVAQLDRVLVSEAKGRGFDSRRAHQYKFKVDTDLVVLNKLNPETGIHPKSKRHLGGYMLSLVQRSLSYCMLPRFHSPCPFARQGRVKNPFRLPLRGELIQTGIDAAG